MRIAVLGLCCVVLAGTAGTLAKVAAVGDHWQKRRGLLHSMRLHVLAVKRFGSEHEGGAGGVALPGYIDWLHHHGDLGLVVLGTTMTSHKTHAVIGTVLLTLSVWVGDWVVRFNLGMLE